MLLVGISDKHTIPSVFLLKKTTKTQDLGTVIRCTTVNGPSAIIMGCTICPIQHFVRTDRGLGWSAGP